jgi:NAD dependent epimerase/dehydratase
MRIFVTGAGGFIGSHLIENLVKSNHEVTALVHYNGRGTAGWLDSVSGEIKNSINIEFGDVTDSENMNQVSSGAEVIINLAALIAIPYSYVAPRSYVNTNVIGTLNICESARRNGAQLVQISTSEVYGTPESTPIFEDHPLKPQSPYAATKVAADQLALSYGRSFNFPVSVIRPFNTYGPRQSMRAIIPNILTQIHSNNNKVKIGDSFPKRDFTFVKDTAAAISLSINNQLTIDETIQLGAGYCLSIAELVDLCGKVTGKEIEIETDSQRVRPVKSEVHILLSNPAKAEKLLGWKASTSLEEGIAQTYAWMLKNPEKLQDSTKYWK